jgi:hypothetical protein
MMEAVSSSETSVNIYQTTQFTTPADKPSSEHTIHQTFVLGHGFRTDVFCCGQFLGTLALPGQSARNIS